MVNLVMNVTQWQVRWYLGVSIYCLPNCQTSR